MAYQTRLWYPNSIFHITQRGNRKVKIFMEERDFEKYLRIIRESIEYYDNQYEVLCYCLMSNHVHLLLKTKERHLKDFITRVNSIYAKFFNNKYDYIGHLYQGRYFSEVIQYDSTLLELSKYIHLNPVKANIVKSPAQYKWSSYPVYLGKTEDNIVNPSTILSHFNKSNGKKSYKTFVEKKENTRVAAGTPGGLSLNMP